MNISEPFVRRPVATTLLTLGVALAGAVAFRMLPVAPLPQVDFPTISVSANLPGASPEVMAATVAMPLERALGRIAGVTEITSSSSLGSTRITLQFELSRDIDGAARDVQAAIQAARGQLPTGLPDNPTYRKLNPADAPIMILALTSDAFSQGQMYDAASTILAQKLSQVQGVGQVAVGGSALPAVRVELNPSALNKYMIALDDVRTALNAANANRPKGSVEEGDRHWQIYANDQAKKAAEYLPLIVAYRNNAPVRLSDVAEVADSVQDVRNAGSSNGRPAVLVIVYRQPGANIIETVDRVSELLPLLRASIPAAINVELMMERTSTIRAALREVERALAISTALVILVVLLFLRSARATLIPAVAVPVSLVGTFGVMYLAGFSVNNLSLMALTIATGFVVDDAIVVLENISRHIEEGVPRMQAALLGAREVGFTVLSMSLSLIAVFIPILLMGGIVGRLFREFSVTLSVAILVSLAVSLTTTPMMCARLLKRGEEARENALSAFSRRFFDLILQGYKLSLSAALRHPRLIMLVLAAAIGLNFFLYAHISKGFFPQQDTGRLIGFIRADQGISFQAMRQKLADFVRIVQSDPAVENLVAFTGGAARNRGSMFIALKPLEVRKISADQVVARLRAKLAREPGATLVLNPVQDIRVGGRLSDSTYQFTLQGDDLEELRRWTPRLEQALRTVPEVTDVNTDQEVKGLQTTLNFDRDTAARLGLAPRQIDSALNLAFGQAVVSTIYAELNQYRVVMEVAPQYWQSPESLASVWLISPVKGLVPLSAIARWETTNTSLAVNHQGQFVASTLSFNLPPGVALSRATQAVQDAMVRIGVPASIHGSFQGTARAFQASLENQPWLILAALVAVYIVLGMLYESYVHPITILSTLPSAGVGALLALMAFGKDFNIIALIGVILLIGIVKKNAIMMIDLALVIERGEGKRPEEAIFAACLQRFRPIMMTTLAALLGAVPLAVGYGYGAELRQPLGISIMGGLILSQLLTLYTTPVVYLYLDRFRLWVLNSKFDVKKFAPLLVLLLLAACAVGPDYKRPAVEAPAAFRETPAEWKQAQPRDEVARGKWWEIFGDAQLDRLVERIDVSNQTLRASEAQYRQAQAAAAAARAALFPSIEFDASVVRSRSPAGVSGGLTAGRIVSTRSGAFNANYEADLWGRVRRGVEAARASAQASAGDLAAARLLLQSELATSYFQLRVLDAQKHLLEDTVGAYQKSLELTQNRYQAGVAGKVDVVQAETQLKSTQAQMLDLGVQRAALEHAIAILTGTPPSQFSLAATREFSAAMPPIPAGLPAELLERRPDVAAAERRVVAANAQIGVAKAAFFPLTTISAGLGSRTVEASQWFTAPSRFWSIGPAIAQTIFDAGLRRAQTDQAIAAYDATVATYRQTVLTAFQEVEDNLAAIRILDEEAKVQDDAVKAARQSVELTVNQYKAGTVSFLNVVTVQATQLANERTAVGLLGQRLSASVALVKALGGGWKAAD